MSLPQRSDSRAVGQVKKLRFITNQGAPHPKRRRVTAACLTCRKRKVACSAERPACATCTNSGVQCSGYAKGSGDIHDTEARRPKSGHTTRLKSPESNHSTSGGQDDEPPISSKMHANMHVNGGTEYIKPSSTPLFQGTRNRMPYFRWLGPTAIMPGFKQMVVKVNRQGSGQRASTEDSTSSPNLTSLMLGSKSKSGSLSAAPTPLDSEAPSTVSVPFYDTSSMPPSELITHLCQTFFVHLGCNFPFLQKERFLSDLAAKQVDAILVDAVCAMAARFSHHPMLTAQTDDADKLVPSDYGRVFAGRAKLALVDTYAVPSVAAVQAALLLAYNEFGESRDSGLWMYLGISIRMAQDLGLHKLRGLHYEGHDGPTPRMVKHGLEDDEKIANGRHAPSPSRIDQAEVRAVERERVDTFWSVFFLDRVVSSGTGRRSTLRDNDIELSFPRLQCVGGDDDFPSPFPAVIRIVHLYGRVADLLNSIEGPSDITAETGKKLALMESQVTDFYNRLPEKLHFEAMNFHHYVKADEGTNFVLLHFWFHTLVILLHNPTLLKTFEGKMLQLFPNSQQLSMSSAKTMADILSYSQLIDAKASLGNPFTTQPIYIAGCAFLKETADRTANSSGVSKVASREESKSEIRAKTSPDVVGNGTTDGSTSHIDTDTASGEVTEKAPSATAASLEKSLTKHALLIKQANKDYQLCYQALQALETYWAGTKYILTVLDQKHKGVGDPLLYTAEEGECALERPVLEPTFTSPGWRRKSNSTTPTFRRAEQSTSSSTRHNPAEPSEAIGWTLTGDLNSTNTNLAWHYPTIQPRQSTGPEALPIAQEGNGVAAGHRVFPSTTVKTLNRSSSSGALPGPQFGGQHVFQSHFPASSSVDGAIQAPSPSFHTSLSESPMAYGSQPSLSTPTYTSVPNFGACANGSVYQFPRTNTSQLGDIMIESQDIDMSMLGMDMLSWLDPPPASDVMDMFGRADMTMNSMGPPPTSQAPR